MDKEEVEKREEGWVISLLRVAAGLFVATKASTVLAAKHTAAKHVSRPRFLPL
jgi:hypothetical protein